MGGENTLEIEVIRAEDVVRFDWLPGEHPYLGETNPAGDFLRQVAVLDGEWAGLLAWGSACDPLRDRQTTPRLRPHPVILLTHMKRPWVFLSSTRMLAFWARILEYGGHG